MSIFNTDTVRDYKPLTIENVLKEVDESTLFTFYFGEEINFKKSYKNPLRTDDEPGCKFFVGYSGKLLFIDFAKGTLSDVFQFVADSNCTDLNGALQLINKDFRLGLGDPREIYVKRVLRSTTELERLQSSHYVCRKRTWESVDFLYWGRFGINEQTLEKFNVIPISAFYKDNKLKGKHSIENPLYCYWFPNQNKKKIYRPLYKFKDLRFMSDPGIGETIQGYEQLPSKGELLLITKSLKDVMTLDYFEIPAIAPHGENYSLEESLIDHLYSRFDNIVVFYDNDKTGIEAAERIGETQGLSNIILPTDSGAKDISSYYELYGAIATRKILQKLIPIYRNDG